MMPPNRVAIVTGAGRGLGREYARELARRGFAVVVNDTGILSLTRIAAAEGSPHRITCNAVAPIARTRMSEHFLKGDSDPTLEPEDIARFVAFLASEESGEISGCVFRVVRGQVSLVQTRIGERHVALSDARDAGDLARRLRELIEPVSQAPPSK